MIIFVWGVQVCGIGNIWGKSQWNLSLQAWVLTWFINSTVTQIYFFVDLQICLYLSQWNLSLQAWVITWFINCTVTQIYFFVDLQIFLLKYISLINPPKSRPKMTVTSLNVCTIHVLACVTSKEANCFIQSMLVSKVCYKKQP